MRGTGEATTAPSVRSGQALGNEGAQHTPSPLRGLHLLGHHTHERVSGADSQGLVRGMRKAHLRLLSLPWRQPCGAGVRRPHAIQLPAGFGQGDGQTRGRRKLMLGFSSPGAPGPLGPHRSGMSFCRRPQLLSGGPPETAPSLDPRTNPSLPSHTPGLPHHTCNSSHTCPHFSRESPWKTPMAQHGVPRFPPGP